MNVTVSEATGAIGSQVLDQLRAGGHTVTGYVRHPAKMPTTWGTDVRVVAGQMDDVDAVVSALGPTRNRKATGTP